MWRVIYTGQRPQNENIALDQVMLELKAEGKIPNTIRFLQFKPECVLIGYHQAIEQEVREEYTKREGIEVGRRITGGGAIYFDETQIGWEIIADRRDFGELSYEHITEKICKAAAKALNKLGVKAEFRPRNDIEVEGKKISGTGGVFEGNAFLYQGTVLVDFNVERMLKSLQIPVEKLTSKGIKAAEDRVTWLKRELGRIPEKEEVFQAFLQAFKEEFGIEAQWGELTEEEKRLLEEKKDYFKSDEWIYHVKRAPESSEVLFGIYRCPGGTFRVSAKVDSDRKLLQQVVINGDLFINPKRLIYDLEAYLKHTPVQDVEKRIREFFEKNRFESVNLTVDDFVEAVMFPLRKLEAQDLGIEKKSLNKVIGSIGGGLKDNIKKAKVMLLPYCAKPAWCDYRHTDDCGECGGCTVGDLYRMAYERGMIPITITSFEMLRDTLQWCAENGYTYIGHCCYEFYEKRYEIFRKAKDWGANGVLIDIIGTTCYDLGVEEEEKAYHGEFQVELDLFVEDSQKILSLKEKVEEHDERQKRERPQPAEPLRDFIPEYYKIPKAVSGPEEDRTRLPIVKEKDKNVGFINGEKVRYEEAFREAVKLLMKAERPTIIVGPLVLWRWSEETERKAELVKKLKELFPNLNVHVLPDYRPKNKNFDPSREIDPPNPHISILHGNHDLTLMIGVHCYRTDFVIRLLKKHTDTKIVTLCNLYGHPDADVSLSGINAEKLEEFVNYPSMLNTL
ncbi:lipoate-protein ligase A [Hydrogenivirga caldilitoris]|uniref:Lipoate-protein ligase A n=1 Tax=Hydrogenivirga caldilitoris TaxID=246264 RepID=A0A497XN64_9AQUI|nr:carbon monoxide dehydrogenase beta subunit family protein [Hydrogenivirga caldilitoris]RLJ70298.1 lipoate-protein ligase A [Hydrogenivirga caldilitoris]